jgi:hypothetical protein
MAHAQKPDFVFQRNGRVHLNRSGGGTSVQSTTGSRGVRISGSNAGYSVFRGSVKGTGYTLHSPVSPSFTLPCVTVCHRISNWLYIRWSGLSPDSYREGSHAIPGEPVWDFGVEKKWQLDRVCSECFGFSLPVLLHRYSTFINSSITDVTWSQQLIAFSVTHVRIMLSLPPPTAVRTTATVAICPYSVRNAQPQLRSSERLRMSSCA